MRELQSGLWWWEAVHPEWTADDAAADHGWGPEVSPYAIDDGERLLLIDLTNPPRSVDELAARRETALVLTLPWHKREPLSLAGAAERPVNPTR